MSDKGSSTRRRFLKSTGIAGTISITGFSGCIGSITGGGSISMGSILPITGDLSDYGSGMQEAVQVAVEDINNGGGPLGRDIELHTRDSETKADRAVQKYNSLVNEVGIVGFVGAASSGVSVPLAQNIAADQVMQVSNASTTPALAEMAYDGDVKYFARTAPNDGQQGIVMGQILNQADYIGADSAAFLYVDNPYGEGLANKASEAFDGETTASIGYDPRNSDYTSTLDKVFADDPDAVGFVGYPGNGKTILQQWNNGGYGGDWVLSEGLNSPDFFESLKDVTDGMYVASPDPEQTKGGSAFEEKMADANTLFAPHAYDAMFLMALAMHKGGEADATTVAKNIQSVSRQGETVTVGEFEKAKQLLDDGTDINYQGASSPVDFNASLEALNQFAILQVNSGSAESLKTIPRSFFEGKL